MRKNIRKTVMCLSLMAALAATNFSTVFAATGGNSFGTLNNSRSSASCSFTSNGLKTLKATSSFHGSGMTLYVNSSSHPLTGNIVITGFNDTTSSKKYKTAPKKNANVRATAKLNGASNSTYVTARADEI